MQNVDQKKENNICEYIIHMYQTEDLLRAYNFDLESIESYVISHLPVEKEEKEEFKSWYASVRDEMVGEGITTKGHLARVQKHVDEISQLHTDLLKDDTGYQEVYEQARPHVDHHIKLSEGKVINPIQICLNGVYGMLLLRLNGKKIEDELMTRLDHFGNVLSYLATQYKLDRN